MPGRGPGSRAGIPCQDHEGNQFKSISEMCRHWGITASSYQGRLERGIDQKEALTAPKTKGPAKPCKDHLGNEYPSNAHMFRKYGINYTIWKYRHITKGWTLEKTLTTPVSDPDLAGAHVCRDHLGNTFRSKKDMCDYWRIPRNVFFARQKKKLSLAQCLAPIQKQHPSQARKITDPDGNTFLNLDDMCAHWKISKAQYILNIRNGLDMRRALTEMTERPDKPKDHLGNEYPSINAMCRAYGITKTTLRARLELGWTLEQILSHPENNSHLIKCVDHLGNEFTSQKDMLAFHNVSHATYKHRLNAGCSMEQALSNSSLHRIPCTDHTGLSFPCLAAMLDFWFCSTATWHHRIEKLGYSMERALTEPGTSPMFSPGPEIVKKLDQGWFLVRYNGHEYIANINGMLKAARKEAMLWSIANDALPHGMRARHIQGIWFHVYNTPLAGSGPGLLLDADRAWLERCLVKYGTTKKDRRDR